MLQDITLPANNDIHALLYLLSVKMEITISFIVGRKEEEQ